MAKLSALRSTLGALPLRLGYQPGDEKGRDRQRAAGQPWRLWYKTARWRRLAQRVFQRDGYTCQQTGVLCGFKAPHPRSPVAHHKQPHKGDPSLFWDEANVVTVSKEWHDSEAQRLERRSPGGAGRNSTAT